jgi:hypothetical protein
LSLNVSTHRWPHLVIGVLPPLGGMVQDPEHIPAEQA